jgi:hypothetical protein
VLISLSHELTVLSNNANMPINQQVPNREINFLCGRESGQSLFLLVGQPIRYPFGYLVTQTI